MAIIFIELYAMALCKPITQLRFKRFHRQGKKNITSFKNYQFVTHFFIQVYTQALCSTFKSCFLHQTHKVVDIQNNISRCNLTQEYTR